LKDLTVEQCRRMVDYYAGDPVAFASDVFGADLWDAQKELLWSIRDCPRVACKSCQGSGKTYTEAVVSLWHHCCFYPATTISIAPGMRQLERVVWGGIHSLYMQSRIPLKGKLLQVSLTDDSRHFMVGIATVEKERVQGFHNDYVMVTVDEAEGVKEEIFNAIENPLSTGITRLFMIGNPTQISGKFHDAFYSPIYKTYTISAFDTPNFVENGVTLDDIRTTEAKDGEIKGSWVEKIRYGLQRPYLVSPGKVAEQWLEWGENSPLWDVYVMGEFPSESADTLFPLGWIEAAIERELPAEGATVFGVDTAKGMAENVCVVKRGSKMLSLETFMSGDTNEISAWIETLCKKWYPSHINIDSAPIASGVIRNLRDKGVIVNAINFGDRAFDKERYGNTRAEMYWNLRYLFQEGLIDIIDDPVLKGQLCVIKMRHRHQGQQTVLDDKYIEDKALLRTELRKMSGSGSPDRADALALAFYNVYGIMGIGKNMQKIEVAHY